MRERLARWAVMEAGRLILWAPVFMIVGIAVYFSLPQEPAFQWGGVGLVFSAALSVFALRRRWGVAAWWARAVFMLILGFALAQVRTMSVTAPMIMQTTDILPVEGYLERIEQRPGSQRWTVRTTRIGGMPSETLPHLIRVTRRGWPGEARPGDLVSFRASLSPPPAPALPGGFDYGRQLFFERIGAVGFSVTPSRTMWRPERPPLAAHIDDLRTRIADRIIEKAGDRNGPVLAALVTGQRERIDPDIVDQLRDTGLAHLLAISGLHMGLVCGFIYFGVRTVLVRIEALALYYPVRKWAAVAALLGGTVYLSLSGGAWSAQRAYIMAVISFGAILFDRQAISLRNVAFVAIIILVMRPEAAMSAGFQMSFAAVTALTATYLAWNHKGRRARRGLLSRAGLFLGGLSTTSLIAGLATTPFAIFHFHRVAHFGLPTNILVMPIVTTAVIPVAVLGLMAMPFGLDGPFWWVAATSIEVVLTITGKMAALPHAVGLVPQWPGSAFVLLVGALLALCLLRAPWRWASAAALPVAFLLVWMTPRPVLFVAEEAANVGFRPPAVQTLHVANRRRERFAMTQWRHYFGLDPDARLSALTDLCREDRCQAEMEGPYRLSVATTSEAAALACREDDVVIAVLWEERGLRRSCRALLFTADSVSRTGPVSVLASAKGLQVRTVNDYRGNRPWTHGTRSSPSTGLGG
ncbi:ComEC/Rec2 family competence protein [Parvularcula sp. LCG005]|uniref:ComEC/Rec2 family competence protein n=1 Tax=Parvularcula sp. LCG005 TaxID=3078805 RepID=UPI002942216B|nr:ComEC/Rec2 family competence protein [Parvularcula sp. LCG005]WOI54141.1 ComEC/Rec2 family competence protein [Parvularcula sp. LCG005]